MKALLFIAAVTVPCAAAFAQSNTCPTHVFAWSENAGWLNFRDAPGNAPFPAAGVLGARLYLGTTAANVGHCRGWVWGENIGWVSLSSANPTPQGSASPINTVTIPHANTSGVTFGVNLDPNGAYAAQGGGAPGALFGFAWSENAGWINFGTTPALGAALGARFDSASLRFRGFAWSENLGWINLDDAAHYVASLPADTNSDGAVNFSDLNNVLSYFGQPVGANPPDSGPFSADVNGDGVVNFTDLNQVLSFFGVSCEP